MPSRKLRSNQTKRNLARTTAALFDYQCVAIQGSDMSKVPLGVRDSLRSWSSFTSHTRPDNLIPMQTDAKKPYVEPTLEKREELVDVTEVTTLSSFPVPG